MSDMIDNTKGFDAIAYRGQTPWHGKGYSIQDGDSTDTIIEKAGLGYNVKASPVSFVCSDSGVGPIYSFPNRNVLYRDDTGHPLGILAKGYKIVQPRVVVDFFAKILEREGATLEVVGALDGGRRVWALAKLNLAVADIFDGDIVEPYLLCATSYDGSLSTTVKATGIRVVCHNTITAAIGYGGEGQSEADRNGGTIRVSHSRDFDPDKTRIDMGVTVNAWERFLFVSRRLARTKIDEGFVHGFLEALLPKAELDKPVEGTKAYITIQALYAGQGMGADLSGSAGTAWGLLNAVTQFADFERGNPGKRLGSAWFGSGDGLKSRAMYLLAEATDKTA